MNEHENTREFYELERTYWQAQYNTSQNVFKRWLFEIISLTISAICMVRITLDTKRVIVCDRVTLTICS